MSIRFRSTIASFAVFFCLIAPVVAQEERGNDPTGPSSPPPAPPLSYAVIDLGADYFPVKVSNQGHALSRSYVTNKYRRWHWGATVDFDLRRSYNAGYYFYDMNNHGELAGMQYTQPTQWLGYATDCWSSALPYLYSRPVIVDSEGNPQHITIPPVPNNISEDIGRNQIISLNDSGDYLFAVYDGAGLYEGVVGSLSLGGLGRILYAYRDGMGQFLSSKEYSVLSYKDDGSNCPERFFITSAVATENGGQMINNNGTIIGQAERYLAQDYHKIHIGSQHRISRDYYLNDFNNTINYRPVAFNHNDLILGEDESADTYSLYFGSDTYALPALDKAPFGLTSPNIEEPHYIVSRSTILEQIRDPETGTLISLEEGTRAWHTHDFEDVFFRHDENGNPTINTEWITPTIQDISDNGTFLAVYAQNKDTQKWHSLLLLKVDLARNSDFSKVLDDWPEDGNKLRSPKYLLDKEDDIFIRLPSLGSTPVKIRVKSESDATGIEFDLSDTGTGYHANLSNGLRLGTASVADQNGHPVIKVIDEEVLTFELLVNGNAVGEIADVMVDRAEFASCGIDVFYGSATGDRSVVRNEALTNSKFFDAGDGNYPDDIVDQGNPMKTFIQNAGAGLAHSLEADFLHISSHGYTDGNLYDHTSITNNRLIFDPDSDIVNSGHFNNDVEWIILAACSQLDVTGGGKAAWEHVMNGNPRKLHGILGAYKPISGNLQAVYSDFWSNLRGELGYVPPAYAIAMSSTTPAQPYAILMRLDNGLDDFKDGENFISQDTDGGDLSYTYLDPSPPQVIPCGRVGESEDEKAIKYMDNGDAIMLAEPKKVKEKRMKSHLKTRPHLLDHGDAQALGKKLHDSGRYQRLTGKIQFQKSSTLSEDDALMVAYDSLLEIIPEKIAHLKLNEVTSQFTVSIDAKGRKTQRTTGYIVQFSNEPEEGISVWGNFVNVMISGNTVENISIRLDETFEPSVTSQAVTESDLLSVDAAKESPLEFENAFGLALSEIKSKLKIKGQYEILQANLCYVDIEEVVSGKRKGKDEARGVVPAWHIVVNPSYEGKGSLRRSQHVWVNAQTGKFIGKKPY